MDHSEHRKISQLLRERQQGKTEAMDWMYKSHKPDNEDYLLGKSIDKHIEEKEEKVKDDDVALFNERIKANIALDMQAKAREDPLFAIRRKEEDFKRKLLDNPIKLKQLQKNLQKQQKAKQRQKQKGKHESSDSEDDIMKKYLDILNKKQNSAGISGEKVKKHKKHKKHKHSEKRVRDQDDRYEDDSSRQRNRKDRYREEKHLTDRNDKHLSLRHDQGHRSKHRGDYDDSDDNIRESRKRSGVEEKRDTHRRQKRRHDSDDSSDSEAEQLRHKHQQDSDQDYKRRQMTSKSMKYSNRKKSSSESDSDRRNSSKKKTIKAAVDSPSDSNTSNSSEEETVSRPVRQYGLIAVKNGNEQKLKPSLADRKSRKSQESVSPSHHKTQSSRHRSRSKSPRKKSYSPHRKSPRRRSNSPRRRSKSPRRRSRSPRRRSRSPQRRSRSPKASGSFSKNPRGNSPSRKPTAKKLTDDEKQKRLQEMMENAKWREEQRNKNVSRYAEEDKKEIENQRKGSTADFVNPLMSTHAEKSTIEDRIKRNKYNIQRAGTDIDRGFLKK